MNGPVAGRDPGPPLEAWDVAPRRRPVHPLAVASVVLGPLSVLLLFVGLLLVVTGVGSAAESDTLVLLGLFGCGTAWLCAAVAVLLGSVARSRLRTDTPVRGQHAATTGIFSGSATLAAGVLILLLGAVAALATISG